MSTRRLTSGLVAALLLVAAAVAVVAAPASSGPRAAASTSQLGAARFAVVVDGREVAVFGDLVGLTSGFETSQLQLSVGGSTPKLDLPTKRMPPSVVLKRGLTSSLELWDWHDDALRGVAGSRKSATLVMFDYDGTPVASWQLANAWPSKLEIGTLAAGGQNVPVEMVTIVSEHLERVAP